MIKHLRGSEWGKWDLHVHTASSFDYSYNGSDSDDLLVKAWRDHGFVAVAITDHQKIDSSRIKHLKKLAPDITIFPGVEMRTDKGAPNIHIISIFPETIDLGVLQNDFDAILIRDHEKPNENDETLVRDFNEIVEFTRKRDGILSIHAGKKANGIDSEITNALPVGMATKTEIAQHVDIFELGKIRDIGEYQNKVFNNIPEKPLVICSDNHDPRDYKLKTNLWIKAEPTFQGLKQIIYSPKERVFVGELPPKLEKVQTNLHKYIDNISISKKADAKDKSKWFEFSLNLNPGLVTIIGNKGSGKSALSDIIAHACDSIQMADASFLRNDKFFHTSNPAKYDYVCKIKMCDNTNAEKNVYFDEADINNNLFAAKAKYLPQRYIEHVCDKNKEQFEHEIYNVIFSYIADVDKGSTSNLWDLVKYKTEPIKIKIDSLKSDLEHCIEEIIKLETKFTGNHRSKINNVLDSLKKELERHNKDTPKAVQKPKDSNPDEDKKINDIEKNIKIAEQDRTNTESAIKTSKQQQQELENFKAKLETTNIKIKEHSKEAADLFNRNIINQQIEFVDFDKHIKYFEDIIEVKAKEVKAQHDILTKHLNQIENLKKQIEEIIRPLERSKREYHEYQEKLNEWETKKSALEGDAQTPNTIKYFEQQIHYLNNDLLKEYENKIAIRDNLIEQIYNKKLEKIKLIENIYFPVKQILADKLRDFEINFDVELTQEITKIIHILLENINKHKPGKFRGKDDAVIVMNKLIEGTDFNDLVSVKNFISNVFNYYPNNDFDARVSMIKDHKLFQYTLLNLDYIDATFKLTLRGRELSKLSPGEKGMVLLVFYLLLDKDEYPLIIDQPEDNLDNESIYSSLVPCICEAKKRRQIIVVTHNPNIAVVCDAEQIIYCQMDKITNRIQYDCGSIERFDMKQRVVNVLEGTENAFNLRKIKYAFEETGLLTKSKKEKPETEVEIIDFPKIAYKIRDMKSATAAGSAFILSNIAVVSDDVPYNTLLTTHEDADYAVTLKGHSMDGENGYRDGEKLLVKKCNVPYGQIGIFFLKNNKGSNYLCKQIYGNGEKEVLRSLNKDKTQYGDIIIEEGDIFEHLGIVLGRVKDYEIKKEYIEETIDKTNGED